MEITLVNESTSKVPQKFIRDWMDGVEKHLLKKKIFKKSHTEKEITLVFLNEKAAQSLNFEFRQKNYATDVLSFDSMDDSSLGELVMCPAVLKKQAKEHGLTYQLELGYMLLHGVLHLLGYDHETGEADARRMFKIQDEIFEKLQEG